MKLSTAEIKMLIKQCASTSNNCTPKDFTAYIEKKSDKEFTRGQIAGAVSQLVDKKELISIERGLYRLGNIEVKDTYKKASQSTSNFHSQFAFEIADCLNDTVKELSQIVEKTDVLGMSREEFQLLVDVKQIREKMEQIIANYN